MYIKRFEKASPRFSITYAQLTELPELYDGILQLDCNNNYLTELPELPKMLKELDISNEVKGCI